MGCFKRSAGLVVFISVLNGCVHFSPRPIVPAESAKNYEQRVLDDAGLHDYLQAYLPDEKIDTWPMPAWDSKSLVLAALFFRADIKLAQAQWNVSRAAIGTAGQLENPVLGFAPQYNTKGSNFSPWILPLTLNVPIQTAGKRAARVRQADQLSRSAGYEIASTAWRVRYEVQQGMLALLAARRSVLIMQEQLRVQREIVRRMQAQLDVGEITSFEFAQSQTQLRALQIGSLDKDRQGKVAEVQLATAIGVPVSAIRRINLEPVPLDQALPEIEIPAARRRALVNRADILGALAVYEAAQESLRLEVARQYPDINLGPGYEFDQDNNKWGLLFSVSLPVLNHNEGPIAEAEARRAEASTRFNMLQSRVSGEIDRAVVAFRLQAETVAVTERVLSITSQQLQRVQVRKAVGELSRLDELNARAALLKTEQDLLRVRIRQFESYYALENTLQGPGFLPEIFTRLPATNTLPRQDKS